MIDLDEGDATIRTPDGEQERVIEEQLNGILQFRRVSLLQIQHPCSIR